VTAESFLSEFSKSKFRRAGLTALLDYWSMFISPSAPKPDALTCPNRHLPTTLPKAPVCRPKPNSEWGSFGRRPGAARIELPMGGRSRRRLGARIAQCDALRLASSSIAKSLFWKGRGVRNRSILELPETSH